MSIASSSSSEAIVLEVVNNSIGSRNVDDEDVLTVTVLSLLVAAQQ